MGQPHLHHLFRVETRHTRLRLVEESDYLRLYNLRRSPGVAFLKPIDADPLVQLDYIRVARRKAFQAEELYYAIEKKASGKEPFGFVRITDLRDGHTFGFHSLVIDPHAGPYCAVDAIIASFEIGFDRLGFSALAPFPIKEEHLRLRELFRKMQLGSETRVENGYVHIEVTRRQFHARQMFLRKLGFGLAQEIL